METSSSLLSRARVHDPQAWTTLVTLYAPLIYGWCRNWGLTPAESNRIGQAVLQQLYDHIEEQQQNNAGESFRNWLFELTRQQYRLASSENASPDLALSIPVETQVPSAPFQDPSILELEQQQLYQRAFDYVKGSFRQQEWEAFLMVVVQKKSIPVVATELGLRIEEVYLMKSKVLRRLRQEFADLLDF